MSEQAVHLSEAVWTRQDDCLIWFARETAQVGANKAVLATLLTKSTIEHQKGALDGAT
jgi:hypothetical protein